jgi:hypothetical protein
MKIFLTLLIGIVVGGAIVWFAGTRKGKDAASTTGQKIQDAAKSAGDAVDDKIRAWKLRPEDIKDELARSGQVIRRSAEQAGKAIADGTADARTTAAIKAKLLTMSISVNTTAGRVTLSGTVDSAQDIGKAIQVAMETDGVREVVSTLQIKTNR